VQCGGSTLVIWTARKLAQTVSCAHLSPDTTWLLSPVPACRFWEALCRAVDALWWSDWDRDRPGSGSSHSQLLHLQASGVRCNDSTALPETSVPEKAPEHVSMSVACAWPHGVGRTAQQRLPAGAACLHGDRMFFRKESVWSWLRTDYSGRLIQMHQCWMPWIVTRSLSPRVADQVVALLECAWLKA